MVIKDRQYPYVTFGNDWNVNQMDSLYSLSVLLFLLVGTIVCAMFLLTCSFWILIWILLLLLKLSFRDVTEYANCQIPIY